VLTKPTENLEAYDFVLRARPALQSPTRANNVEARTPPAGLLPEKKRSGFADAADAPDWHKKLKVHIFSPG
jgi:hypothetical protein